MKTNKFKINKQKIKKTCILLGVLAVISFYLSLLLNSLIVGQGGTLNPFRALMTAFRFGYTGSCFVIIFAVACGLMFYAVYKNKEVSTDDERNFKYSKSGVYGTAKFLSKDELKGRAYISNTNNAVGTILGQLDDTGTQLVEQDMDSFDNKHIIVFGSSGCGKSRTFARPYIIQSVKRRESIIVTDPKGELFESTAQYLRESGYVVKVFNLANAEKSDGWDCLKELRHNEIRAQIFSDIIVKNATDVRDIWRSSKISLLKALLLRVERGKEYTDNVDRNIGSVYDLLIQPNGIDDLDIFFSDLEDDAKLAVAPYMIFKQNSQNAKGNVISGLGNDLNLFQSKAICEMLSTDDIDLTLPGRRPCAYFCIMPDQYSSLKFLSSLFFSFLFIDLVEFADSCPGKVCPTKVNFLLDEFPNIGVIPDFDIKMATIRSRGISACICLQGIYQLEAMYDLKRWNSILGNCDTQLFLGCNEFETAKYIAERSGGATVKVETIQHSKYEGTLNFRYNNSEGNGQRKVLNPDEVMRMAEDYWNCLIMFKGKNILKARKFDYTSHPESKKFKPLPVEDMPNLSDYAAKEAWQRESQELIDKYYETHPSDEEQRKRLKIRVQTDDKVYKEPMSDKIIRFAKESGKKLSEAASQSKWKHSINRNKKVVARGDSYVVIEADDEYIAEGEFIDDATFEENLALSSPVEPVEIDRQDEDNEEDLSASEPTVTVVPEQEETAGDIEENIEESSEETLDNPIDFTEELAKRREAVCFVNDWLSKMLNDPVIKALNSVLESSAESNTATNLL